MPVTRKRKAASPEGSKQTTKSINSYGRVTKSQTVDQSAKKRKVLDSVTIDTTSSTKETTSPSTRPSPRQNQGQPILNTQSETTTSKKRSRAPEDGATTPQNKRFRNALPPTPAETPSKSASKLFERLIIDNPPPQLAANTAQEQDYNTPPLTPRAFKSLGSLHSFTDLPAPIQALTRLFKAFLTSTSLYCAHNGLGTPMYITTLLPHVTKSWKVRAVTEVDMRRILGILGQNKTFELADNGEGSLCIELIENTNTATGHFNQPELIQCFQDRLTRLWNQWAATSPTARQDVQGFLAQLPACKVVTSEAAPSKNARLTKGQERLNDLKSGAILARAAEATSRRPLVNVNAKTAAAVSSRGSNLLDRILAKQASNATRGNGPTPEQLSRLAALDRIPDVLDTLDLLANGKSRVSFSTKTLMSHLQASLRNPISADDGERCLNLMAQEVVPQFVSIIQVGNVRGIVITRAGKPSPQELTQRLERARGA